MKRLRFIAVTALALLATHAAHAQDASPTPSEHTLTPPKLVQAAQPVYPPSKLESGASAVVGLVLVLDESGAVTDVTVATSAGDEFDQAAVEAAKQMRFEPAARDGKPVAAKIPFRIQFEAPPPPAAEPVPAPAPAPAATAPPPAVAAPAEPSETLDIDVE